jgi:lipoprotein signal peptidase
MKQTYQSLKKTLVKHLTFRVLAVSFIILTNVIVSFSIRNSGIDFKINVYPFGLQINLSIIIALLLFVTFGLYQYRLFYRYVIYTILIMSGSWSNLIERFVFGSVTDYINFGVLYANLADMQIWFGVIALNYFAWTDKEDLDTTAWKELR